MVFYNLYYRGFALPAVVQKKGLSMTDHCLDAAEYQFLCHLTLDEHAHNKKRSASDKDIDKACQHYLDLEQQIEPVEEIRHDIKKGKGHSHLNT